MLNLHLSVNLSLFLFFGQSLTQVASAQSPKSKSVPKISTLTKGTTWGCIAEQQEYPPRSSPGWKTGDKSFQRWDTTFCLSPLMLPLTQINNCIYICCAVSLLCTSRCAVCRWYFIILCQFVWLFQRFNHLPLCSLCLSLPLFFILIPTLFRRLLRPFPLMVSISLKATVSMCYRDVLRSSRSVHLSAVCPVSYIKTSVLYLPCLHNCMNLSLILTLY